MGTVVETASALGTSTVHVYVADLDTVDAETDVLSEDELERADRFRFDRDRRRFVAARSALRRMLARYVDASPVELSFDYGPYGKPDVPGAPVSFNVSHSGSCALFAFGPRFELGVDVEVLDHALVDDLLVAKQFFSTREVEALRAHAPSARPRAFLRCWTRKEAFVKARGDGLNLPLQEFDVSFGMGEPPALLRTAWSRDEPEEWTLEDVSRLFPRVVSGLFPARSPRLRSGRGAFASCLLDISSEQRKEISVSEAETASEQRKPSGLGTMRRKAADVAELVQTSLFNDNLLPLVVEPAIDGVDLAAWAASHRDQIDAWFDKHGAILFRGFGLVGAPEFESVAGAIAGELFAEYGDLPPEPTSQKVYGSTPYPPDKMILFHNESSHLPTWPMRQFFFCVIPSATGGTTPLLDSRTVYNALEPAVREQFETKGLMYVRNFAEGIDVPWQDFFHTSERDEVEKMCAETGMTCEWTTGDGLRIRQVSPAVVVHPRTGEKLFFNQVQLHHVYCLDEETRSSLRQLFAEEELPRNVYFGDGSPIPDETMEYIGNLYEELCVDFPWQATDLVAVDNMLVQHARRPFTGERKLLVAMAHMSGIHDLGSAA